LVVPEPVVPEDDPEEPEEPAEPGEPIVPLPDELEPAGAPLPPELSPARRSHPAAVKLNAAITRRIFDMFLSVCIPVPFKKVNVCVVLDQFICDKFLTFSQTSTDKHSETQRNCT
jgi:hypothetical protein